MSEPATLSSHLDEETLVSHRKRNACVLCVLGLVWLLLDFASKRFFENSSVAFGEVVAGPFMGLFQFVVIHNTGGAWGLFSDATFVLGIVSLVISCALVTFLLWDVQANLGQAIGLTLVVAGGLGNAIDRFVYGYVVDFIDLVFIEFPIFNIADIGVTCGVMLFFVSVLFSVEKKVS